MSDYGYNAVPPRHLLPTLEEHNRLAAHLEDAPGVDLFSEDRARILSPNGVHVSSFIRPGFNGLVIIQPYETGAYTPSDIAPKQGKLEISDYGRWCMVYENARHQLDINPRDRRLPDYAPFSLDDTQIIRLRNNGRLLVQETVARISRGYRDESDIWPSDWRGVTRLERIMPIQEVKEHMTHLAIGMALEERDIATFVKQPFRKIVRLMSAPAYLKYTASRLL